tara:strand:+ start:559 stop:1140 length:582 start_codon:yes stop_codon:yes gene_type:complete
MNRLIFATHNPNKLKEVRDLISNSFEILSLDDIGFKDYIEENKNTITENSIKKAEFIKIKTGYDCFADDTGLEVDALNGQPGVFSKRFAGPNASSDENINKLLEMLKDKTNRAASFKTVISLSKNSEIITFEGICEGNIAYERMGKLGFGYDPIFIPKNSNISFGQMSLREKNLIAHRAKAMNKLVDYLTNVY